MVWADAVDCLTLLSMIGFSRVSKARVGVSVMNISQ